MHLNVGANDDCTKEMDADCFWFRLFSRRFVIARYQDGLITRSCALICAAIVLRRVRMDNCVGTKKRDVCIVWRTNTCKHGSVIGAVGQRDGGGGATNIKCTVEFCDDHGLVQTFNWLPVASTRGFTTRNHTVHSDKTRKCKKIDGPHRCVCIRICVYVYV